MTCCGPGAELGILYAKYKPEKLMEHLKLFSARINIPRLIRVTEEYQHWAELTFLYVQYDEFDNAALIMIAHAPTAWEHSHFKDVLVKVLPSRPCAAGAALFGKAAAVDLPCSLCIG